MEREYAWLLQDETATAFEKIRCLVKRSLLCLPTKLSGTTGYSKPEKYVLVSTVKDNLRCELSLIAENIIQAEVSIRYAKAAAHMYRGTVQPDVQWKIQQIGDLNSHLQKAQNTIDDLLKFYKVHGKASGSKVTQCLHSVMQLLKAGRDCVVVPRKRTISELRQSRASRCFNPALPSDLLVSFYISGCKLVCASYQLALVGGQTSAKQPPLIACQYIAECPLPWLEDTLTCLTATLLECQNFATKLKIFEEFNGVPKSVCL